MMQKLFALILLAALALAGNYIHLPLLFSVSFIFGSIAALVALQLYGLLPGMVIAAIGGSHTWILWGHPFAMIIFTIEVLIVGLLLRRIPHLPLADFLYWLLIGVPLVLFFYHGQLGVAENATGLIALKQSINGVFNAVLAALAIVAIQFYAAKARLEANLSSIVFNLTLLITTIAGAAPIVLDSQTMRQDEEAAVERTVKITAHWIGAELTERWRDADAFSRNPEPIGRLTARIAENAPDRDHVSFVVLAKDGTRLGGRGEISSLGAGGTLSQGPERLQIWQPSGDMAAMIRWRQSRYVHKFDLFEPGQFPSVIVEHDTQSVIERIDARQVKLLAVLATIMTFAIAASLIMSNWLTKPVRELSIQSRELVENVVSGTFDQIRFPNSQIREYNELSLGLQEAAERLTESFNELLAMKTTLEERVRERTKALERLSMVASQTTNGVLITDPEGRVQWINEGFTRLSGYAEDDIIGHKPGDVLQGPDTDQATVKQIRKALNDNQEFYAEILNYTKSGVPYWVEISCNPMKNADGEIEGFIAIESNITDRKHADLSKDEFISTISHELRTPLTSIKGGLGLVMGGALGSVPEKATDVLTIADRNAERLIYLVNDILAVQKRQSGLMEYNFERFELNEIVRSALSANNALAEQFGVHFRLEESPKNLSVTCDEQRINQVIANLLSNAAKFSPKDGEISVKIEQLDDKARVSVTDKGSGIPIEFRNRIFGRFAQADSSDTRESGGTGLGLHISQKIIEGHEGAIGYESELGSGTTFYFDIPVRA